MGTQVAIANGHAGPHAALLPQIMESVLLLGDLAKLTPAQRVSYYGSVCESLRLNPLTKPFEYIVLNGRLTLYALKGCTEQLRARDNISLMITDRQLIGEVYVVTTRASTAAGRVDESTGAVAIAGLKGEALANAYLKAETKAKRRVTLSICGLGILDESEVDSVPGARRVAVDIHNGEIQAPEPMQGSQAAADAVAQRKIAELKAKQSTPPQQQESMRRAIEEMRSVVGEESYGIILGNSGFENANQIDDLKLGRLVYRALLGYSRSLRSRVQ